MSLVGRMDAYGWRKMAEEHKWIRVLVDFTFDCGCRDTHANL